jgi:hypothetical protein
LYSSVPPRQTKYASSSFAESGYPRNIIGNISPTFFPSNSCVLLDSGSIRPNPPKDIQVVIRKGDHTGINSMITNMPLQQFRQMIGLQCSSGLTNINDRRISSSLRTSDNRRLYSSTNPNLNQQQPLSSSSSSSSSSLTTSNIRLVNGFKQQENKKWSQDALLQQTSYPSFHNNDRQHSPMLPISPRRCFKKKNNIIFLY